MGGFGLTSLSGHPEDVTGGKWSVIHVTEAK